MKFFKLVLPVVVVSSLLISGCNSGVTTIKSGMAATVNPGSSLVTLSPVPMTSPSAQPAKITMNLKQIKAGNYSSLQGTWKEVAYAENVYDGKGVQWKKGLPASSATLSVSSDKIVYNDLVVIKGSTLTVTIDNGDPAGSHPLEFFIDNDGSLGAELADADKVAINWGVYFYPKGVKNNLEPNNGAKIDNTKNLIVIWTSNMGRTVVFAQTDTNSVHVSRPRSEDKTVRIPDKFGLNYNDIKNLEFWFGSGAGGWRTTLKVNPDGTFNGHYSDSDIGDYGAKYPGGTRYECYFSGKFSPLKKTGAYTYSMKCISLKSQGKVGEEKIIDGVKVINSTPYGFDMANEFFLYLPGKKTSELSEDFLSWGTRWSIKDGVLETYGLFNVRGKEGFTILDDYTSR